MYKGSTPLEKDSFTSGLTRCRYLPGFTLIETLVYLALFTLIIGGMFAAAYALFESDNRGQTKAMLQEEKIFLIGKLDELLGSAMSASVSDSILTIQAYDGSVVQICSYGTDLKLLRGAGVCTTSGVVLNAENVMITKMAFIHTHAGGADPDSVEAGFVISAKTPNGIALSQTASTTRYLHK